MNINDYNKIYFIGNNTEIDNNTINKLDISKNDLIILFNKQICLKFNKIKNHKNKIIFLRCNGASWWGLSEYIKNKNIYLKAYFVYSKDANALIYDDIKCTNLIYNIQSEIFVTNKKVPQTGWIAYNFIKDTLNINFHKTSIYLIGFTNEYKSNTWNLHSKEIEQDFFRNEIDNHKNMTKIDK